MTNETKKQTVERICMTNVDRKGTGIDEMIITEALGVTTEKCITKDDFFRVLGALNLLNAAIKDKRWEHELSYGFIKGRVSRLFDQWIASHVKGVTAFYNNKERAVFFDVEEVVFSYHNIGLSERIRTFMNSVENKPIEWTGIRLQKIPVEVFDLALAM